MFTDIVTSALVLTGLEVAMGCFALVILYSGFYAFFTMIKRSPKSSKTQQLAKFNRPAFSRKSA
jgi:hypothetical protein